MYALRLRKDVEKFFHRLSKRDPKQLEIIDNKILEVRNNPQHHKNLRAPLNHLKGIHIDKSFVLLFSVDESNKVVVVEDYDHHDNVYKIK